MSAETRCFSCSSEDLSIFYEVDNIPVHSVLLMPTREKAVSYPRGTLRLGFCSACGFVQNTAFDASVHEYSPSYEETQGFSPTFNQFAKDLAQTWVDRYDLRNKSILEVGCGKGEFLVLMAELGPNSGIGLDPGYVPERTDSEARDRIEFIQDFYSEKYAHLQADFICCRHTLEHIQPTLDFMHRIRRSIGDRHDTIIGFELPDVARVLKELAFWDMYYEHCSYFSLGSLARLFRASGFDLLELETGFADQYLLLDAKVASGERGKRFECEKDLAEMAADVEHFRVEMPKRLDQWRTRLKANHKRGLRTAIWGSGSKAVSFLTTLGIGEEVGYVTDINPYRHNMYMPGTGHKIIPPAELQDYKPDVVIIMNPVYVDEINADLKKMGLSPELIAV